MSIHIPVMLSEVISVVQPQNEKTYIDGTFGGGGYTRAILKEAQCSVIGLDRDPDALLRAIDLDKNHFHLIHDTLSNLHTHIHKPVDSLILDLGVSSFQFDEAERGFSFRFEGPLDMRMSKEGITAFDVVNSFSEKQIIEILKEYGEEPRARRIAQTIIVKRKEKSLETTKDLADLVSSVVRKTSDIHPATKTFQALRVFVNDELQELYTCLKNANYTNQIVIVTFQGLEVRVIKQWYHEQKIFKETKRMKPTREEILQNPRSRSAELRVFERL